MKSRKITTLNIPKHLHRDIKEHTKQIGYTLNGWVTRALQEALRRDKETQGEQTAL